MEPVVQTNLQLSNRSYDLLKRVTTTILPGISALYFTLAQIWGLPAAAQVVGTIAALNLFLGLVLSISGRSYTGEDQYAGTVHMDTTLPDNPKVVFNVTKDIPTIEGKTEIKFQVKQP